MGGDVPDAGGAARAASFLILDEHGHHFAVVGEGKKIIMSKMATECLMAEFGPTGGADGIMVGYGRSLERDDPGGGVPGARLWDAGDGVAADRADPQARAARDDVRGRLVRRRRHAAPVLGRVAR